MQVKYLCPYWGLEGVNASIFLARVLQEDFDGVEINLPDADAFVQGFQSTLENIRAVKPTFTFVAQQVLSPAHESADDYVRRMKGRLEYLVSLNPDFINSHTGKDHFSFNDNCRIIDVVENISHRSGIPIYHETHRGRFTFHAASLLPYLEKFPQLKLTGDFSHWCTVSESMLADQAWILEQIIPHVHHLHARIGHEHGPQVNDPFAPEWQEHFQIFTEWWRKILAANRAKEKDTFTITPEFGPAPYMPALPYSQKPLSDQWTVNVKIKDTLKEKFNTPAIVKQ